MTTADDLRQAAALWERLLAALEGDCPACGGTGRLINGAWQEWYERSNELIRVAQVARRAAGLPPDRRVTINSDTGGFPRLDPTLGAPVEAPAVVVAAERAIDEHQIARPHEPEQVTCVTCEGHGRALTVVGEQVAEVFTRHGFLRKPPPSRQPGYDTMAYHYPQDPY